MIWCPLPSTFLVLQWCVLEAFPGNVASWGPVPAHAAGPLPWASRACPPVCIVQFGSLLVPVFRAHPTRVPGPSSGPLAGVLNPVPLAEALPCLQTLFSSLCVARLDPSASGSSTGTALHFGSVLVGRFWSIALFFPQHD